MEEAELEAKGIKKPKKVKKKEEEEEDEELDPSCYLADRDIEKPAVPESRGKRMEAADGTRCVSSASK